MSDKLTKVSDWRCFNGHQQVYKHHSDATGCAMTFGLYTPDAASESSKKPCLLYLSGLTCTHANVMEKAGFQRLASKYGFFVLHPDTSPRGVDLPGDSDSWDFGKGAGFYLNATQEPWSGHYKMYDYVLELRKLAVEQFNIDPAQIGIFGHSMGGHGALTIGLKNPELFKSISAFSPICHPKNCAWGKKAFGNYLGLDESTWDEYDAALLCKSYAGPKRRLLVDQGQEDQFLKDGQLQPESLKDTPNVEVYTHLRAGYDHSYYFISTFLEEHFDHHAKEFTQ
ncbi:unnamed protein product, partial [Mesorhabditis spiculigera]